MGMAGIVALVSGGILLLVAFVFFILYLIKYIKTNGWINLLTKLVWIVVALAALSLYVSLWFIFPNIVGMATFFIVIGTALATSMLH